MAELRREHHGDFKAFLCIEPQMFHELLGLAGWEYLFRLIVLLGV